MSAFSEFFLMKPDDVKRYAVEVLHRFDPDEETDCTEIGDGNINYVFQVRSRRDGRSVIVKQADKLLRSSGRPLDIYRNKIEAQTLQLESRLAPDYIPEVYHYDETMAALSMEDISAYKNLRKELLAGRVYGHLAENISTFLAQSLLPTTDLVLDRQEKKRRVQFFTNPELCDITEDLVLTEPYWNYKDRNIITAGNEDFVRTFLYEDEALHAEVGKLRNAFMNDAQALLHGDLHSGSIFANEQGVKIIDPEFAFYGPMGYDIGNVIGNLFFSWANRRFAAPEEAATAQALEDTIRPGSWLLSTTSWSPSPCTGRRGSAAAIWTASWPTPTATPARRSSAGWWATPRSWRSPLSQIRPSGSPWSGPSSRWASS